MKNNNKWSFFYDEAFHDRKIDITKDNEINIYTKDASDIYVGAFIGCKENDLSDLYSNFNEFEMKYKKRFDLNEEKELKGTTIGRKNYIYGIGSFNKNAIDFYKDYFEIFNENILFNIDTLSKTSFFISQVFENMQSNVKYYNNAFLYSITKFLYNYRYMKVLLKLFKDNQFNNSKEIIDLLIKFLDEILPRIKNVKRKEMEYRNLIQLKNVLIGSNYGNITRKKYEWRYDDIFVGLNLMLNEAEIKSTNVKVYIDREKSTLKAAKKIGNYYLVKEMDSKKCIGIRITDILSNFIGRILLALENNLKEKDIKSIDDLNDIDYETKRLLDRRWFNLSENQFNLYKLIYKVIVGAMNKNSWTTYGSRYFDYSTLFYSLIQYIGDFDLYNEFNNIDPEIHIEQFNSYCCYILSDRFNELYK